MCQIKLYKLKINKDKALTNSNIMIKNKSKKEEAQNF